MKKDKKKLQDLIILFLQSNNKNNTTVNKIKDFLIEKNITVGRALNIIYQNTPTQLISDEELCLLTKATYQAILDERINPETFYHDEEIAKAEDFYKPKKTSNEVVIKNMRRENDMMWASTGVPITQIAEWWNNGLITYNLETQRAAKKKLVDGQIIEVASIDQDSVNEIAEKVELGLFYSNVITLNIRKITGEESFSHSEKKEEMKILVDNETTFLDCPDGYHRINGFVKAVKKNPNIKFTTMMRILHCEEKEVGDFIVQESKHNDIDEATLSLYDSSNEDMEIVKEINKQMGLNEMRGRIGRDLLEVEHSDKYTTFQTLSMAIDFNFNYKGLREARMLREFLIKGYSEIIGIFENQFKNKSDDNYITHSNAFIVYTTLLAEVYQVPDWESKLEKLLQRIDFNKSNPTWEKCNFTNTNINKSLIKKIANSVKDMLK